MTTDPLAADCSRCAALCCLMLAFDRGPMFALDKPAGQPCPNLARHACGIHDSLEARGFAGCVRYDCQGAGQIVVQEIFAGQSWQDNAALAAPMAEAFRLLREVQDLRAQVAAARRLDAGQGLPDPGLARLCDRLEERLTPDWRRTRPRDFDLAAARVDHAALVRGLRSRLAAGAGERMQPGGSDKPPSGRQPTDAPQPMQTRQRRVE